MDCLRALESGYDRIRDATDPESDRDADATEALTASR
jgi:hypothetical protein